MFAGWPGVAALRICALLHLTRLGGHDVRDCTLPLCLCDHFWWIQTSHTDAEACQLGLHEPVQSAGYPRNCAAPLKHSCVPAIGHLCAQRRSCSYVA